MPAIESPVAPASLDRAQSARPLSSRSGDDDMAVMPELPPPMPPVAKAVLVTQNFPPAVGGAPNLFGNLYVRCAEDRLTVLADRVEGSEPSDRRFGRPVRRSDWSFRSWAKPFELLELGLRMAWSTLTTCVRTRAAAVHCGRPLPEGLAGLAAKWFLRRKLIVWVHGEEVATWGQYRVERFVMGIVLRAADVVVANSKNSQKIAVEHGARPERVQVVYPGADIARFADATVDESAPRQKHGLGERPTLVTVGRLQKRKGQDMVIRALPAIRQAIPDIAYLIVGGSTGAQQADAEDLHSLVRELNLEDCVTFAGEVSGDELPGYYAAADVFIMPNRQIGGDLEGFGMCFIEAAACGKTSIAGNSGGAVEAVLHEQTGLIVDGESVDAIAAAVIRLFSDAPLRDRFAAAARRRADDFAWDAVFDRFARAIA